MFVQECGHGFKVQGLRFGVWALAFAGYNTVALLVGILNYGPPKFWGTPVSRMFPIYNPNIYPIILY